MEASKLYEQQKRARLEKHDTSVYLRDLPTCEVYERSYMHRNPISHVVMTNEQFLITCSTDGCLKFWKKTQTGIEFVKTFKCHSEPFIDITSSSARGELASISLKGQVINIFNILNFDMINYIKLNFEPNCITWIEPSTSGQCNLAVADSQSNKIMIFDTQKPDGVPIKTMDDLHAFPVIKMRYNLIFKTIISVDSSGVIEYWNSKYFRRVNETEVKFRSKRQTNLNEFVSIEGKKRILVHDLAISNNGRYFATVSSDKIIRVFGYLTGRVLCRYDESLASLEQKHKEASIMDPISFLRRMTIEKDLVNNESIKSENIVFDQSGNFVLYPTLQGIKLLDWKNKEVSKILGKDESIRPLSITLFQGIVSERFCAPSTSIGRSDPMVACAAYKKNRFYLFSNRNPEDINEDSEGNQIKDRDILNEPPTKEEILAAVDLENSKKMIFQNAIVYTSVGDIHLKLFDDIAPKAVENFCTHAKNGYYNGHIFHRIIKNFMIQTGDPTGTGTGGESIWGADFEDEFSEKIIFDEPYMLGMANCNKQSTNGSQFFITVAPCPFLYNKHTVFGKVVRGMDVCQNISKTRVDKKTEKPIIDIRMISIRVY